MNDQTLKQNVIESIRKVLKNLGPIDNAPSVKIEYARDEKFGDYACTIAMDREWRNRASEKDPAFKNPAAFASYLVEQLESSKENGGIFSAIEKAGPGFINLTLSKDAFIPFIEAANKNSDSYGKTKSENPLKIVFEFVSANPTGPLNVVSARAAALGDSCCNLLDAAGHDVFREYYVNDYGNQVRLLGISCFLRFLESRGGKIKYSRKEKDHISYPDGPGIPFPAEGYHGEYLNDIISSLEKEKPQVFPDETIIEKYINLSSEPNLSHDFFETEKLDSLTDDLGKAVTEYILETHKRDLESFRVRFDNFYSERSLHEEGKVLDAVNSLGDHVFEEEGKTVFRSTDFGDDKDRVIIRDDGRPTYLLADIAYHKSKIQRKFDRIYNIWGPDHHGYIKRLEGAIAAMGYDSECFNVLLAQQVNLLDEGKPIVMSKRTGRFITMHTLLEEIPIDVSRYFFIMRSFEAHLDFDFTEARDTSEKNPFYYVAYAHARIRSIFDKALERGLVSSLSGNDHPVIPSDFEMTPERRRLYWMVSRFPEEVRDSAESLEPHRLVTFLYQFATAFSRFYNQKENRVIEQNAGTAGALLDLLNSVAVCLKNGLRLLGMEAPDRLVREDEQDASTE